MRIVEVCWHDAWIGTNDLKISKAVKLTPVVRTTVGFLVAEKKDCLVLSTDRFHKGKEISAPMVIPMGMIVDWWEYVSEEENP